MEETNFLTQLTASIDLPTFLATVVSLGAIVVSITFAEKGITFVKRLIGKI